MSDPTIAVIFFFYGLAFYSMGLPIVLELGRASDMRMRHALIPLAGFAFLHGAHEWFEMFELLQVIPCEGVARCLFSGIRIALLAWSFMGLAAFGVAVGIGALVFFLALSQGMRGALRRVFPAEQIEVVGQSEKRLDIATKVTGRLKYPQDFDREGQLHAKVVWAAHPHARCDQAIRAGGQWTIGLSGIDSLGSMIPS